MILRKRLPVLAVMTAALAMISAIYASASLGETVHAFGGGLYTPYWSPSQVKTTTVSPVTFENESGYSHGIVWKTVPIKPSCDAGVPVYATFTGEGKVSWKGNCTFSQAGAYSFYCSVHGEAMSGTVTVPGTPADMTTHATGETHTEATVNGSIEPEGNTIQYQFEYEGPGIAGKELTTIKTLNAVDFKISHAVSEAVTGLQPGATYKFKLVATYGAGTPVAGATEETFKTLPVVAPSATTLAAEALKETGAVLKGRVNTGGEATEYFFEYGSSASYGHTTPKKTLLTSGGDVQNVSAPITELASGNEYHFRVVAENTHGRSEGLDASFKTTSPPPPPPKEEPPPSGGTTTTPPPPVIASSLPKPEEKLATMAPPLVAGSLKLAAPRHGSSVRGSIQVSPFGAGGRLEVDLLANSASLARRRHSKPVVVGRLVRATVPGGKASFSVALTARGKSALRRHRRLALTVKITLTPPGGAPEVLTRPIVVRA